MRSEETLEVSSGAFPTFANRPRQRRWPHLSRWCETTHSGRFRFVAVTLEE